jgi:hypothetical protein
VTTHTSPPEPDPGFGKRWRREARTPRAGNSTSDFVRNAFSATWWRELSSRLTQPFRNRRGDDWPGSRPPQGLPDLVESDEPQDTFTLETPALGDAHNFLIGVRCSWHVQATAPKESKKRRAQEISKIIEEYRPVVRRRIEETIRRTARDFPPYRAAQAEDAIRSTLTECIYEGDIRIKVQIRVDVCEQVQEDLKKVWHERLLEDAKGDLKKANVELIEELQGMWHKLLLGGLEGIGEVKAAKTSWIAPYALALAQDPEESAAEYLRNMIDRRVNHAERLLTDLGALVVDPRVEAIEFAFGTESALQALLTLLGVPTKKHASANGDGKQKRETDE